MKNGVLAAILTAILIVGAILFWIGGQTSLRASAVSWFHVDGPAEFYTRDLQCRSAIYRLNPVDPKGALPVSSDFIHAIESFENRGIAALQIDGFSPRDLLGVIDLGGENDYSRQLIQNLQRVRRCTDRMGPTFAAAFDRLDGTLVFRSRDTMIMVHDPAQNRLFLATGDYF